MNRWQESVDLAAELLEVPAVLLLEPAGEAMAVRLASALPGNPFAPGEPIALALSMLDASVMPVSLRGMTGCRPCR